MYNPEDTIIGNEKYGCSKCSMELMLFIRKKMRDVGLAPSDIKLGEYIYKKGTKEHYDLIMRSMKESKRFIELFPNTYECDLNKIIAYKKKKNEREIVQYDIGYADDGWNYEIIKHELSVYDWIQGNTHLYYNELDHFLTHYVGNIKRGIGFSAREEGLKIIKEEIENMK